MTTNPFEPPKSTIADSPVQHFGWFAAVTGAAITVAGLALFGTLIGNITVSLLQQQGLSPEQAYAYLAQESLTIPAVLGLLFNFLSGIAGGYISARQGKGLPLLQGGASAAFVTLFIFATYISPNAQVSGGWQALEIFLIPAGAVIAGALLYAKRT